MQVPSFQAPPRVASPVGCLGDDPALDVPCLSQMMDAPELLSMLDDLPLDPVDSMLQLGELGEGPSSPCASGIEGMLQEHQLFLEQQEARQRQQQQQQQQGITAMEVKRSTTPVEQQTSSSTGSPLLLLTGEEAGAQTGPGGLTGEALGTWSLHFMAEGWYPVSDCVGRTGQPALCSQYGAKESTLQPDVGCYLETPLVPRCAVLCCAVLCCAVLCCAVLC